MSLLCLNLHQRKGRKVELSESSQLRSDAADADVGVGVGVDSL